MASGNLLCRFGAAANQPPTIGFATPDVRNGLLVIDFDPTTVEAAIFVDVMPPNYGGGGLTVKIRWMATTAVSGSVRWGAAIDRHQRGVSDQDVDSYGTAAYTVTAAVNPSGTEMETTVALPAPASTDGVLVGERFRLYIARDATNAADDMVGDAELVQVDVYET